jgi:hypothetical protein
MNVSIVIASLLRLLGPELDEVHRDAALELPSRRACAAPLEQQPYDCPERVRWALTAISDREMPGDYSGNIRWAGRHRGDAHFDLELWRMGHRRGAQGKRKASLAWWCPAHWSPTGMSTVGVHSLMYAYNVHRLGVPGNCVPWWMLGIPSVSVEAATDRYLDLCDQPDPSGWCPTLSATVAARRRRCDRNETDNCG